VSICPIAVFGKAELRAVGESGRGDPRGPVHPFVRLERPALLERSAGSFRGERWSMPRRGRLDDTRDDAVKSRDVDYF